ncbi:MAG: glycosyltransferase [Alphaproteobacteria bacterium]|nr:glycosyltransferase [Alphaproteobacteria bacterium]
MPGLEAQVESGEAVRDSTLVLLTLNEIDGLRLLWDEIPVHRFARTVAVDGGSTDGTREFLAERGIPILDQPIPGRGVAFRVAVDATDTERIVFYSPDGNEDPGDIEPLDDLIKNGARLAIASRFAVGSENEEQDAIRARARVNQMLTWVANKLFNHGPYVTDTINGFRALRCDDLRELNTSVKRFPIEYQISIRSMKRRWPIGEVATIEAQRAGGESKALSWPVGKDHIKVLLTELPGSKYLAGAR